MKFFFPCIAVALLFVACDDHISVAPREGDSLLPVCEGCVRSSSSDIALVSNSSETALLGSSAGPASRKVCSSCYQSRRNLVIDRKAIFALC